MKTLLILSLSGALLGIAVASFVVPPALSWYSEPGGVPGGAALQALVRVPDVIKYATGKLIQGQVIGAGVGASLGLALGIFLAVRARRKPSAS